MMEVVVTTVAIRHAKSNRHHQQTNTQLFTDWMPFLLPTNSIKTTKGVVFVCTILYSCACSLRAAPKLKDVAVDSSKARELYLQCIHTMRTMYHTCHLIHADLSEFNLL